MPRQLHLIITADQKAAAERLAKNRPPSTWQQVAREALHIGLQIAAGPVYGDRVDGKPLRPGIPIPSTKPQKKPPRTPRTQKGIRP